MFNAERSNAERAYLIHGKVSDVQIAAALSPDILLSHLRSEIVSRLTDRIMERVGPAFDRALIDVAVDLANERRSPETR